MALTRLDLPSKATPRPAAPRRRFFAGATASRLYDDWWAQQLSADGHLRSSLRALRLRARQLHRDTPFAQRLALLYRANVIGEAGIQVRGLEPDAEAAWMAWCRDASMAGDTWCDVQDQYAVAMAIDGEFLLRRVMTASGPRVQILDPDQLDELHNTDLPDGARISMGVEQDRYGRPVAYHLTDGHPDRGRRTHTRVPAAEIIHVFRRQRAGQSRGIPPLAPVMLMLKMLDGYMEAELVASRLGSSRPIYMTQDNEITDAQPADGPNEIIEPGQTQWLPPGVQPVAPDLKHPNAAFESFLKAVIHAVAIGSGVSYTSLSGDYSDASYSSARTGLLDERDEWRTLHRFTVEHLCRPVLAWWATQSALLGVLRAAVALRVTQMARFQPRGWPWVDPLKDIQTAEREIALGLNTREALAAERGRNFDAMLPRLKVEQDASAALGVPIGGLDYAPTDPAEPDTTNQQAARHLRVVRGANG